MDARAAITADHAVQGWRDLLPRLDLPALSLVARKGSVFAPDGPAWVGENTPQGEDVFFEESGHMLFHDEPERFEGVVRDFLAGLGGSRPS